MRRETVKGGSVCKIEPNRAVGRIQVFPLRREKWKCKEGWPKKLYSSPSCESLLLSASTESDRGSGQISHLNENESSQDKVIKAFCLVDNINKLTGSVSSSNTVISQSDEYNSIHYEL